MKKYNIATPTLLILFLFIGLTTTFGQFERMEISYSIEESIVDGEVVYSLEVNVDSRSGAVVYSLYNDAPVPQNLITESSSVQKSTYVFENLKAGRYSVMVYESESKGGFETIDVGTLKN